MRVRAAALYLVSVSLFLWALAWHSTSLLARCEASYRCARHLQPPLLVSSALFPTLHVDVADHQWRAFREKLSLLVPVALAHATVGALIRRIRLRRAILAYDALAGLGLVVFIHRAQAVHLFVLAGANYALGRACRTRSLALATSASWVFLLGLLVLREFGRRTLKYASLLGGAYSWLDAGPYGGMGWWDHANLLALRMHSFHVDTWHLGSVPSGGLEYVAYVFYAPLYVAGPIMRAKDFRQQSAPLRSSGSKGGERLEDGSAEEWSTSDVAAYALRWLFCLIAMEWLSASAPCFALSGSGQVLEMKPAEALVFSYLTLQLTWLKFVLIWCFFRLWALLDGRRPPENLSAFSFWHYSALSFWRSWHASFSAWVLTYLYLPLGGRKHRMRNLAIAFVFVALWHGVEWRMLGWAGLVLLALTPEVLAERRRHTRSQAETTRWYHQHLVAAAGASSICALIVVNLVGFGGGGADSVLDTLRLLLGGDGLVVATVAWAFMFVGVHIMMDVEQWRAAGKRNDRQAHHHDA